MSNENHIAATCCAAIRRLAGDFGWSLLPEDEFVVRTVATLVEKPAMTPLQACQHVYSRELYGRPGYFAHPFAFGGYCVG